MKPRVSQLAQSGATDDQVLTWDDDLEEWVPRDPNSLTSLAVAKGDLLVATGPGTFVRLPVSVNDGATLVTDATTTTGLRWDGGTPPPAGGTYTGTYEGTY